MRISYNWLSRYLPVELPIEELSSILTSIGLEVESVEKIEAIKGGLKGIKIGKVLTCEQHPNADKLKKTTVDVGAEHPLNIVCGASNVAAGQTVVVATVGAWVYPIHGDGFEIKKAKIRGELSEGMICAEDELGLGESHDGIMVLDNAIPAGMEASTYFKIPAPELAIEIGLTPNRNDAMSHIGVARDVCAYINHHQQLSVNVKHNEANLEFPTNKEIIQVSIADNASEACKRYAGVLLEHIKVGASPEWLKTALNTIGVRSINNVVDITNYVLHEYGQPLHAFDAEKIKNNKIIVGFVEEGTAFVGLDGKERKLQATDLMISDAENPLCIAGVFGGASSGVTDDTTSIFLESAFFDGSTVRKSSLHHQLRTDAATHFEKCVDIKNVIPALKRAVSLLQEFAGATIASSLTDIYPVKIEQSIITLRYNFVHQLTGKSYSKESIKGILESLNFEIIEESDSVLTVRVPSNKNDVYLEADIIEEILRIDGLDQIEIPNNLQYSLSQTIQDDRKLKEKIAAHCCGLGFFEIITNSITNSSYYPNYGDTLVTMINSLTSELNCMRPTMLESGLEVLHYNINRKQNNLSFFEFGNIYSNIGVGNYHQQSTLALWITGDVRVASWTNKAEPSSIYYLKAVIEQIVSISGCEKIIFNVSENQILTWKYKNQVMITAHIVDAKKLKQFDIKQSVYFAEFNWELLYSCSTAKKIKYSEVPKFPEVQRDLALVLDKNIQYDEVQKITKQLQIPTLKHFDLFDVFESEKLGANKKSYALNFTFQHADKTLTDVEIESSMQTLINTYQNKLKAEIRS
jgi:phenylalanyl-tRNA synthetase beta chain